MGATDPQRLGDFEILRELGRGGMGVVYEARQVSLNRPVALKVLSGGLGLTPKAVQRFRREAEAAARLHHTNIVPVYATGEEDGTHFYAMELIDGPSLDHVIRQLREASCRRQPGGVSPPADTSRSPELVATGPYVGEPSSTQALSTSALSSGGHYFDTVARMVAEVADALDYAHQNGVVHRDLKPSNLLLSPAGRLSLTDFGLARVLEQPGMTLSGEFVGTPAYMSPEQVAVGRIPLDHRTDIYSLGATLYELLTLEPPHTGNSREQVLAQIVQKEPKPPRRIQKRVPVDLETICLKCLEKDPDRRYQSAGELAEDLRRYVNRFAISARRVGPVGRLMKWIKRRPAVAASLACAVVAITAAAFFAYQAHLSEQQRRGEQEQKEKELLEEKRHNALEKALAAAMGGDLDKAEKAISEAEVHEASLAQLRMLRGMVAFYRGDYERAFVDLEQAVKLDPDSVAARGMLAVAYFGCGDWHRYYQTTSTLEALYPRTAEDYLFKGYAQHYVDFDKSLQNLDEAVKRSHSPLARAIRAKNHLYQAEDHADLEKAERALADVRVAKEELPDNPFVLSMSVWAHAVAANLYLEAGEQERQQATLEEAKRDAQGLKHCDALLFPFQALWVYFEQTGQEHDCFDLSRRAAEKSDAPVIAYRYALALYRRGKSAEALEVLERSNWKAIAGDYLRVCVLAELHPQELSHARAACEEMVKRYALQNDDPGSQQLLRLFGYKNESVAACRALRLQRRGQPPLRAERSEPLLDYFCEEISENEYLKAFDRSRWGQCFAHYTVALTHLAEGERDGAREHFRRAVQHRLILDYRCDWSRSFLARMEKDPNWPRWIPIKKLDPKP
jgi:hypothetical protein